MSRKKLQITLGVKAAKHEWIILTEPNCRPSNDKWLQTMVRQCQDPNHLVLGYVALDEETKSVRRFDSIRKAYTPSREFLDRMQDLRCDFIRSHADQEVAVYALSRDLSMQRVGEMLDVVAEPVRTGVMAPLYRQVKEGYDKEMERRAAAERVKEGNPAPDFTLKDLKGNDFTLSSLRGKYVVLDFWGSWCGWCIKGVPDMKKAYAKHKAKVEFVGIDCRDTEEKWRKAVAEHDMPWLHVRNEGKPDVSVLYAVRGYPTKIVLSPEGTILKIVVGEDPEFYSYLDELLNS